MSCVYKKESAISAKEGLCLQVSDKEYLNHGIKEKSVVKSVVKSVKKLADLYYSLSIKNRISILFIILSFMLLIILTISASIFSSHSLIKKTIDDTVKNLNLVSGKFDIVFDNVENYSKIAIRNRDVQEILFSTASRGRRATYEEQKLVTKALRSIIEPKTNIDAMFIYDYGDNIFDSGNIQFEEKQMNRYVKECLSMPTNSFKGLIMWMGTHESPYQKTEQKQDIISFFRKLVHEDTGKPIGTLEICINQKYLSSLYSEIKLGKNGHIFVIDNNGVVISSSEKNELYKSISMEPYYKWVKMSSGGGRIFDMGKDDYLVICKHYSRLDWTIIGLVPTNEIIYESIFLRNKIFSVGIICILFAVFMSMMLSSSITRPIIKLKDAIKLVGEGNLEVKVDNKFKDEIGVLMQEFNRMVRKTSELMQRIIDEQQKKKKYELALLNSQINPHFLCNTLECICGLAGLGRNADIINIVQELALFYRGVLSKGSEIIPLKEEIGITERYLKILKMRYGDQLEYEFDIDKRVFKYQTLKLLLQPLVENSVYHGLKNKRGKGYVKIKGFINDSGKKIHLDVIDNGAGIKPEKVGRIFEEREADCDLRGFGLKNIDERIKVYFGSNYGLSIKSTYGEGTTVSIVLPLKEAGEKQNDKSDYCR